MSPLDCNRLCSLGHTLVTVRVMVVEIIVAPILNEEVGHDLFKTRVF